MIRIMIADDHTIVRKGLVQILSDQSDIQVSIEARSGDEVLKHVSSDTWDIMVLDIAMPGKNVLEVIHLAKFYNPKKAILILSGYPEEKYGIRMLKAGADGYLNKECAPDSLITAILTLFKGGKYISNTLATQLVKELHSVDFERPSHTLLTNREFQVFMSLSKGKRLSNIAVEMALSIKTISTYRTRILKKMRLSTNGDLIHYAITHQLLDE